MSNPRKNHLNLGVRSLNVAIKEVSNNASFIFREDVTSHKTSSISTVEKDLNTLPFYNRNRQVCVSETQGAKNLVEVKPQLEKARAGATTPTSAEIKGLLITFVAKSELKGLKAGTIKRRLSDLELLIKRGANLLNFENVFRAIDHAKRCNRKTGELLDQEWSDGSKSIAAQAYKSFCELNDIAIPKHINFNKWSRQPQKLPWVPLEREVDALIAGCSRKVATFLQTLKETGMRCGEAWRLKWIDVDTDHNVITVNNPEKHGVPRQLKISAKLVAMLNGLPKKSERVFASSTLAILRCNFMTQRKRIAFKLKNPRLRRITFHTLRHFKGTMEYHKTKDILHVKELLGHRKISSTLVYTHLVNFESDDYTVRVAKTLREDEELLKAGFEYVTERENLKIYRKRK
jgi:integrase